MVQDRDGFLWAAARDGLYRFDGLTFEKVEISSRSATSAVLTLAATRDGAVWIGRKNGTIEVYRKGVFKEVRYAPNGTPITRIVQAPDNTIWAVDGGSFDLPLLRLGGGTFHPVGANLGLPHDEIIDLVATSDGSLWASFFLNPTLMRLAAGAKRFEPVDIHVQGHAAISEDHEGRVWLSDDLGTRVVWTKNHIVQDAAKYETPSFVRSAQAFWDRDGNLWSRTDAKAIFRLSNPFRLSRGSYEVPRGKVETLSVANTTLPLEDREGNLWVYSASTLERYRNGAVVYEPGLTDVAPFGDVLTSTSDGTVYVGEHNAVYRVTPGHRPVAVLSNLGNPRMICPAPDQSIAIGFEKQIFRVSGSKVTDLRFPDPDDSHFFDCAFNALGDLWVTRTHAGLFRFHDRKWQLETVKLSVGDGGDFNLAIDSIGRPVVLRGSGKLNIIDPVAAVGFLSRRYR